MRPPTNAQQGIHHTHKHNVEDEKCLWNYIFERPSKGNTFPKKGPAYRRHGHYVFTVFQPVHFPPKKVFLFSPDGNSKVRLVVDPKSPPHTKKFRVKKSPIFFVCGVGWGERRIFFLPDVLVPLDVDLVELPRHGGDQILDKKKYNALDDPISTHIFKANVLFTCFISTATCCGRTERRRRSWKGKKKGQIDYFLRKTELSFFKK